MFESGKEGHNRPVESGESTFGERSLWVGPSLSVLVFFVEALFSFATGPQHSFPSVPCCSSHTTMAYVSFGRRQNPRIEEGMAKGAL